MQFAEVEAVFKHWLYLDHDPDVLRILFAIYLANRYDGVPVWAMLIGKPGCGKSELLGSLAGVDETVMVSTLTPNALASGYKDGENSLLHLLKSKKMLIIKDMSCFTEMPMEARVQIFSTLRDAYDGSFIKRTGNGFIEWHGKFGILGGATQALERVRSYDASLGERFLSIKFRTTDGIEDKIQQKSMENSITNTAMKDALKAVTLKFFKEIQPKKDTIIPIDLVNTIMHSAKSMVKARSSVSRDRFTREVDEMVSTSEVPTRVTNQLLLLARACLDIETDEITTKRIIQRCCLDSIPSVRIQIMKRLIEGTTRSEVLREQVRMSKPSIERCLEDMWFLHLVKKDKSHNWNVSDEAMCEIMINTGQATPVQTELKETM